MFGFYRLYNGFYLISTPKFDAKNTPDTFEHVPDLVLRAPGPENKSVGARGRKIGFRGSARNVAPPSSLRINDFRMNQRSSTQVAMGFLGSLLGSPCASLGVSWVPPWSHPGIPWGRFGPLGRPLGSLWVPPRLHLGASGPVWLCFPICGLVHLSVCVFVY